MKAIVDATNPPVSGSSASCAMENGASAAGLPGEEPAGPAAGPSGRARRNPMQERSQETVQRIFAGAAKLLSRGLALADVTTAMIATEAGVSVGALYRFFPDKQAIVDAIAARHMEAFKNGLLHELSADPALDGPSLLGRVIEAFYRYLEANPAFVTVAYGLAGGGRYVSRPARDTYAAPTASGASLVNWFMSKGMGGDAAGALDWRIKIATETGDRLLGFAFEQPDPADRRRVIEETKRLLAAYLFPA
jgi:AcrR family transcriptional regulator